MYRYFLLYFNVTCFMVTIYDRTLNNCCYLSDTSNGGI